ncbi:MAG TPA: SDR family oxidoreductase [Chitinophagales bacterium]|nr:SDR family oxidoreductase [Chitinophagales bacterium]HRK26190.1 SDR family oxidoreductase [Chitinophagales bacterium]
MKEKVVIITGANSGIGKAAAIELAKQGAHIVMVCRNKEKAEAAKTDIIAQSGNQHIDLYICDLASQKQIRQLAAELRKNYPQIHVLLNNAGLIMADKQVTQDGLEMTFATNHLSYFLLTNLLLDVITATPQARIVNVSSGAHQMVRSIDFDNLQAEKSYSMWQVYGLSKLGNIFFTYELARRLAQQGCDTTVNCLHPGVVSTNFAQKETDAWWVKLGFKLLKPLIRTPEQGAETSIYLASSPDVAGISGKYFDSKKAVKSSPLSYNPDIAAQFWEVSRQLTGG